MNEITENNQCFQAPQWSSGSQDGPINSIDTMSIDKRFDLCDNSLVELLEELGLGVKLEWGVPC